MPGLITERLLIEPFTTDDAPFMLAMLNDPDFVANVADRGVRTEAQARKYLQDGPISSYRSRGFGMYAVRRRDSGDTIGVCGLVKRPELEDIDIGYGFLPAGRGQGLAIEAAQSVWDYATEELGLTRLIAIVAPHNTASIKLLEKLGLRYEADVRLSPDEDLIRQYGWHA